MKLYYTKCGRTFKKSTNAETTGYHIPENESGGVVDQKCAVCPFLVDVKDGWPEQIHKRYECRAGSEQPNHKDSYNGSTNDKCTLRVYSLDNEFCERVIEYARSHPELGASYNQDLSDCRRSISVSCSANKKGMVAKQELIDKFFPNPEIEQTIKSMTESCRDEETKVGICNKENYSMEDQKMPQINKDDLMKGLFGDPLSQESLALDKEEIIYIDISLIDELYSFEHPFAKSLKRGKGIEELAEQIRHCGVLQPTILRKRGNGRFETLAGHRRKLAASIAELTKVPAIIKTCDDDMAKLIVTYTNLGQREEMLLSEKAKAYKMALDAIKRVAGRPTKNANIDMTDENGTPMEYHFNDRDESNGTPSEYHLSKGKKSIQIIAEKGKESAEQVRRYIRLNELIEPLLDRVDDYEIPLRAAVEISYLKQNEQEALEKIVSQNSNIKLTEEVGKELRAASEEMRLSDLIIEAVLDPPEDKQEKAKDFKPPKPVYKEVFKVLEKQFKKFPQERAEKLAQCQKEVLEEVVTKAINEYLDTL
jgi:ParB family chromosome partitioning protein